MKEYNDYKKTKMQMEKYSDCVKEQKYKGKNMMIVL